MHEYAASGFPLLLSNQVGAKEQFLQEGKNGFEFKAQDITDIKSSLKKIVNATESELQAMSVHSNNLSKNISPSKWVTNLLSMTQSKF